jgi:hypothetical protein
MDNLHDDFLKAVAPDFLDRMLELSAKGRLNSLHEILPISVCGSTDGVINGNEEEKD